MTKKAFQRLLKFRLNCSAKQSLDSALQRHTETFELKTLNFEHFKKV